MQMPSDKDILFQILGREVDNFLISLGPVANAFSTPIKNYLFSTIEPYVDAFLFPNSNKLNTKAATTFVKEEVNNKVNNFLKKFEAETGNSNPNDYIV